MESVTKNVINMLSLMAKKGAGVHLCVWSTAVAYWNGVVLFGMFSLFRDVLEVFTQRNSQKERNDKPSNQWHLNGGT